MPQQYQLSTNHQDKDEIYEAYRALLNRLVKQQKITEEELKKRLEDQQQQGLLTFDTPESAKGFFNDLAADGEAFLAFEVTIEEDGAFKDTGHYFFSDGQGRCYEGNLSPELMLSIRTNWDRIKSNPAIHGAIQDGLKTESESTCQGALDKLLHSTHKMRAAVVSNRPVDEIDAYKPSSPFSTKPRPPGIRRRDDE